MSTISANPFALLSGGDSDDEGGVATSIPVKAIAAKQPSVSAAPQQKKTIPGQQVRRDRGDYPARGAPRKVYGAPHSGNADLEVIGDKPAGITDAGRDDRAERRGGGAGRGRGVRGRGTRGRGGRRFDERPDRHSATGVRDTDRKVASGWGADEGKPELQAETEGWGDAKADMAPGAEAGEPQTAGDEATTPVANGHSKEAEDSPPEEEDKTKTFEEYLAEKANAISNLPGIRRDPRKPNDGVDESQWQGAVKLVKGDEEDEVFFQGQKEKKTSHTSGKKSNKEKTYIEVEPLGYRPPRSGGERGSRGRGGRGRGDRDGGDRRDFNGGPRGGRGRGGRGQYGSRELNTEDARAFPSLS